MAGSTTFHACPTCGAKQDVPCRTLKGRLKKTVHDTRPFSLNMTMGPSIYVGGTPAKRS